MANRIYEEVVDLIVSEPTPAQVIAFQPSEQTKTRFWDLMAQHKSGALNEEDRSELEHYLQIEHILRLAKARARLRLNPKP